MDREAGGNNAGPRKTLRHALRLPLRHEMGERVRGEVPAMNYGRAKCVAPLFRSLPATALRGERAGARLAFAWQLQAAGRAHSPGQPRFASPTFNHTLRTRPPN